MPKDEDYEIGSPIPVEEEFRMLSFESKENDIRNTDLAFLRHNSSAEIDKLTFPPMRNNSSFFNHLSDDEGDNLEEPKKDLSFNSNYTHRKNRSISFLDNQNKTEKKFDELFGSLSPNSYFTNHNFKEPSHKNFFS